MSLCVVHMYYAMILFTVSRFTSAEAVSCLYMYKLFYQHLYLPILLARLLKMLLYNGELSQCQQLIAVLGFYDAAQTL